MRDCGLSGRTRRRFIKTTVRDLKATSAGNVLDRAFDARQMNEKWVTDITYLPTQEGWVYLASIMDLFSRRIVGYSMAEHMRVELVLEALKNAVALRRPGAGLLHHSDQGSQYTSYDYQKELTLNRMVCSMSRKGECWDNSVAESFFGRLKEEVMPHGGWKSRQDAIDAVREYIDAFYNSKRIQKRLGYICPIEYELLEAATAAA